MSRNKQWWAGFLTNVLIRQFVSQAHTLGLMLHGFSIDNGRLELFSDAPVDCVALVGVVSSVAMAQTANLGWIGLQSPRLCTSLNEVRQVASSRASSPSAWCRLGRASTYPTCHGLAVFVQATIETIKTYMASINSSTFHPCSELMGTAFGMRYSKSSSSMLIASILLRT